MSFNSAPSTLINQLPLSISFPEDNEKAWEYLTWLLRRFATTINTKEAALYNTIEAINSQQYFDPSNTQNFRLVYRMVVNFGALPNTTSKSVAHNIDFTSTYTATRIYATASDTTDLEYIPIPYATASSTNNVQIDVNGTDVVITTASNMTNYNVCYVVIEYLKN